MFIFYTAVLFGDGLEHGMFFGVQIRCPVSIRKSDQSGDSVLSKAMNTA
jgi:hypothetical protein